MRKSYVAKLLEVAVLLVLICILLASNSAIAARKNVVIGSFSWSGSIAIEHVMKYVLEEKLNIPVEIWPLNADLCWHGMDQGAVDVYPDMWMPNQQPNFDEFVSKRKTVAVKLSYDQARQGFYVTTELAKKHGIRSVFDLKGKEKIFDMTGSGKGDIWVGAANWNASEVNQSKVREYGLDLKPLEMDHWVFVALLRDAMRLNKPMVFYYWEPEWPMAKYDLTRLVEPSYDKSKWIRVKGDLEKTRISCAWPETKVYVGVSKQLKKRLPKAYKFFMNWHIPADQVSLLIGQIEYVPGSSRKDPAEAAKAWVESQPKIVNTWLKGIR